VFANFEHKSTLIALAPLMSEIFCGVQESGRALQAQQNFENGSSKQFLEIKVEVIVASRKQKR
jgi:hypothetical protein